MHLPSGAVITNEPWHNKVQRALQREAKRSNNHGIQIRDISFVDAGVKLIKCFMDDVPIDISANQVGGLATMCFLEECDRLIGKEHLFKRSVILAKAWCYYESRLLGSHHGLISTYALTALILFVFNMFHTQIQSPLQLITKFLHYFSQFDWNSYCLTVNGPLPLASAAAQVEIPLPEDASPTRLLSIEFLERCKRQYTGRFMSTTEAMAAATTSTTTTIPSENISSNSSNGSGVRTIRLHNSLATTGTWPRKFLNIMDPLRDNNNLGIRVSKTNFLRIQAAFQLGNRTLQRILLSPQDTSSNGSVKTPILDEFFRHAYYRNNDVNQQQFHGAENVKWTGFSPNEPYGGSFFNVNGNNTEELLAADLDEFRRSLDVGLSLVYGPMGGTGSSGAADTI